MPYRDGTGPDGKGSKTGRGLGPCGGGSGQGQGQGRGRGLRRSVPVLPKSDNKN